MLKNKIVHFPAIHGTPFGKFHSTFSNRKTTILYCKKEIVLLYNRSSSVTEEKALPFSLFPSLIQKAKNAWVAQSDLWAPQRFNFSQPLTKYYIIQSLTSPSHLEGPAWSSKNFLHATASAASPSNEWGSKNCIFNLN